jgi:CHAD domain-containing protein
MNARLLRKRWRRALESHLKRAAQLLRRRSPLNAEAVHDLRVALRRTRLLLQLASKHRDRQRTKRQRAAARDVLDTFAQVRDLDVTLDWARDHNAPPALLSELLQRRVAQCHRAEHASARLRPKLRRARLKGVDKTDPAKLARRYARWLDALSAHCHASAARARHLSTPELHTLRRDIRRWRYLRELAVSPKQLNQNPDLRRLVKVQEALGAIQNLQVVVRALKSSSPSVTVRTLRQVARIELAEQRAAALRELARLG